MLLYHLFQEGKLLHKEKQEELYVWQSLPNTLTSERILIRGLEL